MKNFYVMFCLFFVCFVAEAQTQEITGTVVDDQNLPLGGVSVAIEGTNKGTVTV